MGQGEFGGGGSVIWEVVHGNGDSGTGNKNGGKGKDKNPAKGTGGIFTVYVNGAQVATTPVDGGDILITWGGRFAQPAPVLSSKALPPVRLKGRYRSKRSKR